MQLLGEPAHPRPGGDLPRQRARHPRGCAGRTRSRPCCSACSRSPGRPRARCATSPSATGIARRSHARVRRSAGRRPTAGTHRRSSQLLEGGGCRLDPRRQGGARPPSAAGRDGDAVRCGGPDSGRLPRARPRSRSERRARTPPRRGLKLLEGLPWVLLGLSLARLRRRAAPSSTAAQGCLRAYGVGSSLLGWPCGAGHASVVGHQIVGALGTMQLCGLRSLRPGRS